MYSRSIWGYHRTSRLGPEGSLCQNLGCTLFLDCPVEGGHNCSDVHSASWGVDCVLCVSYESRCSVDRWIAYEKFELACRLTPQCCWFAAILMSEGPCLDILYSILPGPRTKSLSGLPMVSQTLSPMYRKRSATAWVWMFQFLRSAKAYQTSDRTPKS